MEKAQPPPYSSVGAYPVPQPGFNVQPPNQPQGHSPQHQQQPFNQSQGYIPQQGQQATNTTVIVQSAPTVAQFGPYPQPITCPHCHSQITSRVLNEPTSRTHLIALALCILCCIPCCIIPYCVGSCQNRNHYCPKCTAFLGSYNDAPFHRGYY